MKTSYLTQRFETSPSKLSKATEKNGFLKLKLKKVLLS